MPLGDVPKGATVNTTVERPDGISLHVVHTDEPNDRFEEWCSRKNKVRSLHQPATQRRRHASAGCSQGSFMIVSQQTGDSSGCSRTEIRLAVLEGIQEAISEDRSHPLNGRCSRLSRQCTL